MDLKERANEMKDFFNEKISSYDEVHAKFMNTKNEITNNLEDDTIKVLDLGAGTGLELISLFEKYPNAEVTAIDITENMLDELKKRDFSDKVKTICGDFFEVEFGDNYDAVISTSALHHFLQEDKKLLYSKILLCLKENGIFINVDKIAETKAEEEKLLEEYYKLKDKKTHCDTPLTADAEVELLKNVGFFNIEVKEVDAPNYILTKARKKQYNHYHS